MSDKIIKYYLLCTVRLGSKAHMVDKLPEKERNVVFTQREIKLFLREIDGHYIANEVVVGGKERYERKPIIVI